MVSAMVVMVMMITRIELSLVVVGLSFSFRIKRFCKRGYTSGDSLNPECESLTMNTKPKYEVNGWMGRFDPASRSQCGTTE